MGTSSSKEKCLQTYSDLIEKKNCPETKCPETKCPETKCPEENLTLAQIREKLRIFNTNSSPFLEFIVKYFQGGDIEFSDRQYEDIKNDYNNNIFDLIQKSIELESEEKGLDFEQIRTTNEYKNFFDFKKEYPTLPDDAINIPFTRFLSLFIRLLTVLEEYKTGDKVELFIDGKSAVLKRYFILTILIIVLFYFIKNDL